MIRRAAMRDKTRLIDNLAYKKALQDAGLFILAMLAVARNAYYTVNNNYKMRGETMSEGFYERDEFQRMTEMVARIREMSANELEDEGLRHIALGELEGDPARSAQYYSASAAFSGRAILASMKERLIPETTDQPRSRVNPAVAEALRTIFPNPVQAETANTQNLPRY